MYEGLLRWQLRTQRVPTETAVTEFLGYRS